MRSLQLLDHSCQRVLKENVDSRSFITGDPEKQTNYVAITLEEETPGIRVFAIEKHSQPLEIAHYRPHSDLDCSIVDFTYRTDGKLCLSTRGGDIVLINPELFERGEEATEIVGSVEAGIMAAAWSPDQDLVVLITGEKNVLEMTDDFETIAEFPLHVEQEGEGVLHSVGWGRKETQFHGSEGKEAALRKVDTAKFSVSEDDNGAASLSWRGDGSFFVCSDIDSRKSARVLRIYNREGILQNTSEPVDRLEHSLDWRPSGNLIVSSQRLPHRHDIVFFERNGLRHGEFALRETRKHRVLEVAWNSDSTVLAVWIEIENESTGKMQKSVQLWTTGNYHWYMKQHLVLSESQDIVGFAWDSEIPLRVHIVSNNGCYHHFNFTWEIIASTSTDEKNPGYVAVVDGASILLTPFSYRNVPPPMSAFCINVGSNVQHISFRGDTQISVVSLGKVLFYELSENGHGDSILLGTLVLPSVATHQYSWLDTTPRQLRWITPSQIIYLQHDESKGVDMLCLVTFAMDTQESVSLDVIQLEEAMGLLYHNASNHDILAQSIDGKIYRVDINATGGVTVTRIQEFPEFCPWIGTALIGSNGDCLQSIIGLTDRHTLYANEKLISSECTSFFLRGDWMVFTTTSHAARFLPLNVDFDEFVLPDDAQDANDESYRRVERGSKIVLATQSKPNLVLQMPRGNLETISPRAFVLASIREDIKHLNFRSAFIACRRNRIDLNILYDENPTQFLANIQRFIEQVPEVDHLNLFLSTLRNEDTSVTMYRRHGKLLALNEPSNEQLDKVNRICKEIRSTLYELDRKHYMQSIISTHVRSSPPDLESALLLLAEIREQSISEAEDALKYTIFLCKADSLYNVALGMYNFPLVLMIAQQAQKDPREYLPFLQELQSFEKFYQRFKIDDHLGRSEKAIHHLILAGTQHTTEAMEYMKKHSLYLAVLEHKNVQSSQKKVVWGLYGDYLEGKSAYEDAGIAYTLADSFEKAMKAYHEAGCWREMFSVTNRIEGWNDSKTRSLALNITEELKGGRKYADAAVVACDYLSDIEKSVEYLLAGSFFQEAIRISHMHNRSDMIETHVMPGLDKSCLEMDETLDDLETQFKKQKARLHELRTKKIEQPQDLQPDDSLDNVDMFSDTTSMYSQFTRYTQATSRVSTVSSSSSRRSAKQRRKEDRKRASGKKGSVFEEEYLVTSLKRLYERVSNLQNDIKNLLRALVPMGRRDEAREVQAKFSQFVERLQQSSPTIFVPLQLAPSRIMSLEGADETINEPVHIEKPVIADVQWKLQIL